MGVLRNSSRNSGSDQERPEFVYFEIISVKITTNVPDSFSRDACGFEFRNGPSMVFSQLLRSYHVFPSCKSERPWLPSRHESNSNDWALARVRNDDDIGQVGARIRLRGYDRLCRAPSVCVRLGPRCKDFEMAMQFHRGCIAWKLSAGPRKIFETARPNPETYRQSNCPTRPIAFFLANLNDHRSHIHICAIEIQLIANSRTV